MSADLLNPAASLDQRALRDAFGCFATGVTVVTSTNADGSGVGFTANSFTSVSLDPALLLVCAGRSASSLPALRTKGAFAVNVLAIDQEAVSRRFTQRGVDRFEGAAWERWSLDVPILAGACAAFECRLKREVDGGDHAIFLGEIVRMAHAPDRDPLLYFQGRYRRVHVPH